MHVLKNGLANHTVCVQPTAHLSVQRRHSVDPKPCERILGACVLTVNAPARASCMDHDACTGQQVCLSVVGQKQSKGVAHADP